MLVTNTSSKDRKEPTLREWRLSSQPLLPQYLSQDIHTKREYQIFPFHSLGTGKIFSGFESLAQWMIAFPAVIIDGYSGIFWHDVRDSLSVIFENKDLKINWIDAGGFMKPGDQIQDLVDSFLGDPDSLWGTKCKHELKDFFEMERLVATLPEAESDLTIIYGTGAALVGWEHAPVIFLDIPKNEIQYRMRAGSIKNLGTVQATRASKMYKQFYFIDWVVLNKHKKQLLNKISVFADGQWINTLNWMTGESLTDALSNLSKSVLRVRPWFEAGAWGGQWMKDRFKDLNKDEVNYAWSFELIVPENGIVFESDGFLLELSFDFLMFADNRAVLGKHASVFGDEFPIRFDFLDTWNGGNLSIQCHPTLKYMRETFGENLTQDETYYIVDCKENAQVYLGFQEDIQPDTFRKVLEDSRNNNKVIQIEKYVQVHKANKHDLFLIPNGTVHSAGANNMVLEISATPYIFTFKMYDWLRLDLNGEPRAINIEHAFNNLKFEHKGDGVRKELISTPELIDSGEDWQVFHLPTHKEHFYDVHRVEFNSAVLIETNDSCHVLMLVEGTAVRVETSDGRQCTFYYAETFVIPAAAMACRITNLGKEKAKVVKAFIKENIDFLKTV